MVDYDIGRQFVSFLLKNFSSGGILSNLGRLRCFCRDELSCWIKVESDGEETNDTDRDPWACAVLSSMFRLRFLIEYLNLVFTILIEYTKIKRNVKSLNI